MIGSFPGTVVRATGSRYDVQPDADGEPRSCRIRGRLRLEGFRTTSPVAVGDRVECRTDEDGACTIVRREPRRNYLIRRASNLSREAHVVAANIDQALAVVSLRNPETPVEFIDRFLATCEAYGVPVRIVLNKADLLRAEPEMLAAFQAVYRQAGYEVLLTSVPDAMGLDTLREWLGGRRTLLSGNSGVGKSSLVAAIEPGLRLRTGAVSAAHHKGRHTTTFAELHRLTGGGEVIDSPGIKGFGLVEIAPREIARYLPDLDRRAAGCRFADCTHTHEPGCAVRAAVEEGLIAPSRYESYLKMLEEDEKYRK